MNDKLTVGFVMLWLVSLMLILAFWGVVLWAIVRVVTYYT